MATTPCIALEITDTGRARPLDVYETACILADMRRWDDEPEEPPPSPKLRRFSPDPWVLAGTLTAAFNVALGLCQIAGVI